MKRVQVSDWTSWPRPSKDDIEFGGWGDNWDGGLARVVFWAIRLYDEELRDEDLRSLLDVERQTLEKRFGR